MIRCLNLELFLCERLSIGYIKILRCAYTDSATCLQLVRDYKKTKIVEQLQRSRKSFLEVTNQLPIIISRELSFEHAQKTGGD